MCVVAGDDDKEEDWGKRKILKDRKGFGHGTRLLEGLEGRTRDSDWVKGSRQRKPLSELGQKGVCGVGNGDVG